MAIITKVLYDDHQRVERLFSRYSQGESSLIDIIIDEIELHSTIEEEIVYPALAQIDEGRAEASQQDHDEVKEVIGEIQDLEPGDPGLTKLMRRLERLVMGHVEREERDVFSILKSQLYNEGFEMGDQAFALRQEILASRGEREEVDPLGWPNSGWGPAKVVGGGW